MGRAGFGGYGISRRDLLRRAGGVGRALAAGGTLAGRRSGVIRAATSLSVLTPLPPDPAPPGVANYAEDEFAAWQEDRNVRVSYDAVRWPDLRDEIAAEFD